MYTSIIQKIHDQSACDHFEIKRIYELFKWKYYWRGIRITMIIYIIHCYIYKRIKASRDREHDLLQLFFISQKRWQDISMNFIVDLSLS